jgi:hypothetical protein
MGRRIATFIADHFPIQTTTTAVMTKLFGQYRWSISPKSNPPCTPANTVPVAQKPLMWLDGGAPAREWAGGWALLSAAGVNLSADNAARVGLTSLLVKLLGCS